jgi:hypothetical protein
MLGAFHTAIYAEVLAIPHPVRVDHPVFGPLDSAVQARPQLHPDRESVYPDSVSSGSPRVPCNRANRLWRRARYQARRRRHFIVDKDNRRQTPRLPRGLQCRAKNADLKNASER